MTESSPNADALGVSAEGRRTSVYADALSTPTMPSIESPKDSPDVSKAAHESHDAVKEANNHQDRAASPTDNLTVPPEAPAHSNGHGEAPNISRSNSEDPHSVLIATLRLQNGDLHSQVDMLNSKLVASYGRYGDLEEQLDRANHQLADLQRQNESLTTERQRWEARVEGGILVEKAHVQDELTRMMDRVMEETAQRGKAETDKETIEKELDELSASLFGEANRMVATEREARAVADAKSQSLEERLRDTEGLISHQADQMRQLGGVIEGIERERDEFRAKLVSFEQDPTFIAARDAAPSIPNGDASQPTSPRYGNFPFFASRLPELLTDILPHHEFHVFVRHLHRLRVNTLAKPYEPSSGSSTTQRGIGSGSSAPPSPDPQNRLSDLLPLSQHISQPFIKRCQEEDSDPTLRLDLAPGLNWLNRRQVGQSIIDGSLVIEPTNMVLPANEKCTLCGQSLESWLVDPNVEATPSSAVTGGQAAVRRLMGTQAWASQGWAKWAPKSMTAAQSAASSSTSAPLQPSPIHVFRTSDAASTGTRYALCPTYCLPRLRAVCDLWTAIRNIERSLLMGDKSPTPGLGASTRAESSRKSLGIGSVSNLLRRSGSSETREVRSPTIADVPTMPQIEEPDPQEHDQPVATEVAAEAADTSASQSDGAATPQVIPAADEANDELVPDVKETTPEAVEPSDLQVVETIEPADASAVPPPLPKRAEMPPPLPKRSDARSPGPFGLAAAAPIRPPPKRRVTPATPLEVPSSPTLSAWEEKAWQDLVKLKEALFWARVGVATVDAKE